MSGVRKESNCFVVVVVCMQLSIFPSSIYWRDHTFSLDVPGSFLNVGWLCMMEFTSVKFMFLRVAITVLFLYCCTIYISKLFLNSRYYIKFICFPMNQYIFFYFFLFDSLLFMKTFFPYGANSVISNLSLCCKDVKMAPCSSSRSFGINHVINDLGWSFSFSKILKFPFFPALSQKISPGKFQWCSIWSLSIL